MKIHHQVAVKAMVSDVLVLSQQWLIILSVELE